uniref:Acyl-ACP synthetase n=1 Tax=Streptoalloteichus sp. ATCC 53650 TaxID=756733 RepID=K4P171_9PSEU|nr:acyl-ACP synthetase [Streptoalloteichus sp. ATCC 53650]
MTDTEDHLLDVLEARAEALGDATALSAPDHRDLGYRALVALVRRTGEALRGLGVGRDDAVVLALPSGPALAAAFLGVAAHSLGAPLNPALPADELDRLFTDLRPRAVLVPAGTAGVAADVARAHGAAVLTVTPDPAVAGVFELTGEPVGPPAPDRPAAAGDDALVLFTSGTIAQPRQVRLTHRNLCAAARNTARAFALGPADRCLNVMPLFHAHGLVSTLLASVVRGASVICPPGFDAHGFFAWLHESRPTWYTAVPAMHRALLEAAPAHAAELAAARLRLIRSASAPLPGPVLDELERVFRAPVIEAYGMTEGASLVTSNPLPPGVRKRGSVGLPVGEPVRVLDAAGHDVPTGTEGEIAIRGANVTRGYHGDPAATAAARVGDWLRTGDFGRLDEDGYLHLVGRVKEIVNRGGSKVAPAEVDAVLADHPDLAQAAAFALPHATLGEDVAVAVVPRPGVEVDEERVRAHVAARLAPHKVPSRVFVVDDLPRNATGKVRRLRLAELFAARADVPGAPPGTGTERAVAAIWGEVLGREVVDARVNFFDLDGDSLAMVRVADLIGARMGHEVPVSVLLVHPTVRALARYLDDPAAVRDAVAPGPGDVAAGAARLAAGRDRLLRARRRADQGGEDA